MIDMKLTRQYFDVKDVRFGDTCSFAAGILTVSEKELQALTADLFKAVGASIWRSPIQAKTPASSMCWIPLPHG